MALMVSIESALIILLVISLVIAVQSLKRSKDRLIRIYDYAPVSKIPMIKPKDFDTLFVPDATGVALQSQIFFIGTGEGAPCLTNDTEAWILSVLSKKALNMFEFGTASGRTTYLWAMNSSSDARVTTITLHPDQQDSYRAESSDNTEGGAAALRESIFTRFVYSGTSVESKVTQLYGDSKVFDETPYLKAFDLIFIDGSHSYSYVKSDTEKALKMLAPGGTIVWHDYRNDLEHTKGVVQHLDYLANSMKICRIFGTSLAVYKAA